MSATAITEETDRGEEPTMQLGQQSIGDLIDMAHRKLNPTRLELRMEVGESVKDFRAISEWASRMTTNASRKGAEGVDDVAALQSCIVEEIQQRIADEQQQLQRAVEHDQVRYDGQTRNRIGVDQHAVGCGSTDIVLTAEREECLVNLIKQAAE